MSGTRTRRRSTVGVGLVALVSHAAHAALAAPTLLPISDAEGYRLLGKHLAEGHGYIRPYDFISGAIRPTAEFPPGFPGLLAVLHLVGIRSVEAQRFALAGVHALVAVLVVCVARRWWSDRTAVVLGLLAAVHPALIQPGAAMLAESLFALAAVVVLLLAIRLVELPSPASAALLGLAGGAAALVRSEGLVLAALLVLPALVVVVSLRHRMAVVAAFVAGLLLLPGAWALRNLTTFEEPVLISNNIGSVLSGANCDQTYSGDLTGFWLVSEDCFAGFRDADLATADESVVADALRDDGVSYARANAGELPRVATVRVLRTFQLWEPEQQARLATFEGRRLLTERITGWVTWATLALAAVGAGALIGRRRYVQLWLLASPVVLVVGLAAVTYGNPRFRMAAEIPMLLLAAEGIRVFARRVRRTPEASSVDPPSDPSPTDVGASPADR